MTVTDNFGSKFLCVGLGLALWLSGCSSDSADEPVDSSDTIVESKMSAADYAAEIPAVASAFDAAEVCPDGFADALPAGLTTCFSVAEQERSFFLALPEGVEGPRPILIAFNGTGGNGEDFFNDENLQDYVDAGFIVLTPSSKGNGTVFPVWDAMHAREDVEYPNPDLDFFDAAVSCTRAHYEVDDNRMYVTGHSAGGIMTNYVLQRRSESLAGGIVASGIMSLTKPEEIEELDEMAVIVTWGGDNDDWSGDSSGGADSGDDLDTEEEAPFSHCPAADSAEEGDGDGEDGGGEISVPGINFTEQASIASQAYEGIDGGNQIWCKGKELGHEYLNFGNAYFIDFLLSHPKGLSINPGWEFVEPASTLDMTCGTDAFVLEADEKLRCEGDSSCAIFCDATSVCGLSNSTVSGVLEPQLDALGLPKDAADCDSCISKCTDVVEGSSNPEVDAEVMSCFAEVGVNTPPFCGPGIDGVYPFVDLVNGCCVDRLDSVFCTYVCEVINENSAAQTFFTDCAPWLPAEEE